MTQYPFKSAVNPSSMDSLTLVAACAANPSSHALWSEFLERVGGKIKTFIRGTLQRSTGDAAFYPDSTTLCGAAVSDLFQETVLRLVENDCASLKRFSGTSEEHLFAYLAVISRSVVRQFLRGERAQKRPRWRSMSQPANFELAATHNPAGNDVPRSPDHAVLMNELEAIGQRTIADHSGANADRDYLMFRLYFNEGLTIDQISQCRGIELTKAGVEKALNRMKSKMRYAAGVHSTGEFSG